MSISGSHIAMRIGDMSPVLVPGVQEWAADDEADELDGQTAEDEGFDNPDDGSAKCTVRATLVMDITAGSFAAIKRGTLIQDLKLYADIEATTPIYHLPFSKVFRSSFKGSIKGRVTYDVTIKSKGKFFVNEPN